MKHRLIVYDIDGTVANNDHRQHWIKTQPKNWKEFFAAQDRDEPYEDIIWMLRQYEKDGHTVVAATGRSYEHHATTVSWLTHHQVPLHGLYMRPADDHRPDYIVKVDLLQMIRDDYAHLHDDVYLWFDDRNQVVQAIREKGVRVLQVKAGDY